MTRSSVALLRIPSKAFRRAFTRILGDNGFVAEAAPECTVSEVTDSLAEIVVVDGRAPEIMDGSWLSELRKQSDCAVIVLAYSGGRDFDAGLRDVFALSSSLERDQLEAQVADLTGLLGRVSEFRRQAGPGATPARQHARPPAQPSVSKSSAPRKKPASRVEPEMPRPRRREVATRAPIASSPTVRPTRADIVLIGSSTGGVQALGAILAKYPRHGPAVVIVQHTRRGSTQGLLRELERTSQVPIRAAEPGLEVTPETAWIAPADDRHLVFRRSGGGVHFAFDDGPAEHHQRPAVDVTFRSGATTFGRRAVACLLTGMGRDGADGLLLLKNRSAFTIAEAKESCVVHGMPRAAMELGAACEELTLPVIADYLRGIQR